MVRGSASSFQREAPNRLHSANEKQLSCYYADQTYSQNFLNITTLFKPVNNLAIFDGYRRKAQQNCGHNNHIDEQTIEKAAENGGDLDY
jgi:hypothetical protein